jgi:vacuolar-type H+-ATPase subunit B/Vma2
MTKFLYFYDAYIGEFSSVVMKVSCESGHRRRQELLSMFPPEELRRVRNELKERYLKEKK